MFHAIFLFSIFYTCSVFINTYIVVNGDKHRSIHCNSISHLHVRGSIGMCQLRLLRIIFRFMSKNELSHSLARVQIDLILEFYQRITIDKMCISSSAAAERVSQCLHRPYWMCYLHRLSSPSAHKENTIAIRHACQTYSLCRRCFLCMCDWCWWFALYCECVKNMQIFYFTLNF